MEEKLKVIESVLRQMQKEYNEDLLDHYTRENALIARIKALEEHLTSLDWASDGNGNHPDDGGWFD